MPPSEGFLGVSRAGDVSGAGEIFQRPACGLGRPSDWHFQKKFTRRAAHDPPLQGGATEAPNPFLHFLSLAPKTPTLLRYFRPPYTSLRRVADWVKKTDQKSDRRLAMIPTAPWGMH